MDGNRRFARERNLPLLEGHRQGADKLKEFLRWTKEAGVENVIVWAFSTENWKRAPEEVTYLLNLMRDLFKNEIDSFLKEDGVLKFIGNIKRFPEDLQRILHEAEEKSKGNTGLNLYVALSYGGRDEIINAVKNIVSENPPLPTITEEYVGKHMMTEAMPDPDLIIRTSGEKRLSGFLPWQGVYSELFFIDSYWPAFTKEEFDSVLKEYEKRERRFGA